MFDEQPPEDDKDGYYAIGREPGRFYLSRRFALQPHEDNPAELVGEPARFAYQVTDPVSDVATSAEGHEITLRLTDTRQQLKALLLEDGEGVLRLWFQRFNREGKPIARERFTLTGEEIDHLGLFLGSIQSGSLANATVDDAGLRLDTAALLEIARVASTDPDAWDRLFKSNPGLLPALVQSGLTETDVYGAAHRRDGIERFQEMLGGSHPEAEWQAFFEEHRWVLGAGLTPQFIQSFHPEKLERALDGGSVNEAGRRPDALMATAGALAALVLVEIKTPQTPLLGEEYRTDIWAPSPAVAGAVGQCLEAADRAVKRYRDGIIRQDADGYSRDWIAVARPRSLLVVGSLDQFQREGAAHSARFESFERFRRSIKDPEIVTFDELYERARLLSELRTGIDAAPVAGPGPGVHGYTDDFGPDEAPF